MKILFITHYSHLYGANRSLMNLVDYLESKDCKIHILSPDNGQIVDEFKKRNNKYHIRLFKSNVHLVQGSKRLYPIIESFSRLFPAFRIIKLIKKLKPDIVYTNSSVVTIGAIASWFCRIHHVWHVREFGREDYQIAYDFGEGFLRFLLKRSKAIIAISNTLAAKKLGSIKNAQVVYNGVVHNNELSPARRFPHSKNPIIISIIGLLSQSKGQKEAILAFNEVLKQYHNVRLWIVGDGPSEYKYTLMQLVKNITIEKYVDFLGFRTDIHKIYEQTDILLMCSEYEAFGRVTVESMASGVPVIGKNCGGTAEIIMHKKNGLLYSGNHLDLFNRISELLNNPDLYEKLSMNGLSSVKKNFTIENYGEKIHQILLKVIHGASTD